MLENIVKGVTEFEAAGFQSFETEWRELDLLKGQQVSIQSNEISNTGIGMGIDIDGGLVLEITQANGATDRQVFHAGEAHIGN